MLFLLFIPGLETVTRDIVYLLTEMHIDHFDDAFIPLLMELAVPNVEPLATEPSPLHHRFLSRNRVEFHSNIARIAENRDLDNSSRAPLVVLFLSSE